MPTEHPSHESGVEEGAQRRIEACLREVSAFLDAVELMGHDQWHALHDRFEALGPAKMRKLTKTVNDDWLQLTSWPEVTTIPAETALRVALRSHWARLGNAIQKARMEFVVDRTIDGMLNAAADAKVKTIWFRTYLESSDEGRRALGTITTLFDGLLRPVDGARAIHAPSAAARVPSERDARATAAPAPASAPPRLAAEPMPEVDAAPWRLRSLDEALALRTAKVGHPVSPAYSVLLAISERIDARRGRRLTHGERLFVALFDELNAEWENGGLEQYLTNSSGDGAEHARAYLGEIGAWGTLALLDEAAWRFCGGVIPRDSDARNARIEAVLNSDDDANRWLDAADRRWRTVQKELYERLVDYVADHRVDFARPTARELARGVVQ